MQGRPNKHERSCTDVMGATPSIETYLYARRTRMFSLSCALRTWPHMVIGTAQQASKRAWLSAALQRYGWCKSATRGEMNAGRRPGLVVRTSSFALRKVHRRNRGYREGLSDSKVFEIGTRRTLRQHTGQGVEGCVPNVPCMASPSRV